ncbi:MAG: SagB family peptide dehydrogenase [Actinomycetota bacterium]|nr:SagB family peptide dehydrogenase [Actinomycetota bacterium]
MQLSALPADGRAVLESLARLDLAEAEAEQQVIGTEGTAGLLPWRDAIIRLDAAGLLERSVLAEPGLPVARLRRTGSVRGRDTAAGAPAVTKLSRFTVLHAADGKLVAERPGSHATVEVEPMVAGVVAELAQWTSVSGPVGGLSAQLSRAVIDLLAGAGLLAPGGPDDDQESTAPSLAQWHPADLWLHGRHRNPRLVSGYGGSYPLTGRFPPIPAIPAARPGPRLDLRAPDLRLAAEADPPFTDVLERRTSVRAHDPVAPITLDQLGELLYRSARVRNVTRGNRQELANRPYPSGGALHELEIYPLITQCEGAQSGLWHYAASNHQLEHIAEPGTITASMVAWARGAAVMTGDPQVVLIITARFGRILWKYNAIGYPLILKHVGVLYQTIYLVGTAMGLGVCGLGGGDGADFAAASGLDYHEQGSVGEMVVGTPARDT